MDLKIKNKKADVPVTMLVIMIVAVCVLAILSFINSANKVQADYLGIELIEGINSDVEKFYFYLNVDFSADEAAEKIGADVIDNKLIISKNEMDDEKKMVEVEYEMNIMR